MKNDSPWVCILFVSLGLSLLASEAGAATVFEDDEVTVELRGLLEAGGTASTEGHTLQTGPRIGMARLAGRARYKGRGQFVVQYEASGGDARLLDMLAVLHVMDWLDLRAGFFKTPISTDFNIGADRKPFPARALVANLTPRRAAGAELRASAPLGEATTTFHAGAFQARTPASPNEASALFTGRAQIEWPMGLGLHLAYTEHFDRMDGSTSMAPFFVTEPRLIDVAATFEDDDWFGHAEAVIAPHREPGAVPAGVYVAAGHRFGVIEDETTWEPIVGYDLLAPDTDLLFHRVRAGLNTYLLDTRIVPSVHYEMTIDANESVEHAVLALLRIGL